MNVLIIGVGYVGLVTAVCLAEKGHSVTCMDTNIDKIKMLKTGKSPIFERDLENLIQKNKQRLKYITEFVEQSDNYDIIFIAVGTPEKYDGNANLKQLWNVVHNLPRLIDYNCVIVIKSTVPIGTNEKIEQYLKTHIKSEIKLSVVSNPEFLSQGTAIKDTLQASRIVIGSNNDYATQIMLDLYHDFDVPKLITDRQSAEMIKYASNDFLALKISYINEIANLCEIIGANIDDVSHGMALDERIGNKFLRAGIGYGGSCFPKDTKALHWMSNLYDKEIKTVKAAIDVNEQQKLRLIKKARKYIDDFSDLKVAVLGLTFKPETDDLRDSPAIVNIDILLEEGANVFVYDPVGMENFKKLYKKNVKFCKSVNEALKDADVCFIFTEWKQFQELTYENFRLMKKAIIIDGRNCFDIKKMCKLPIIYDSIGRITINNL